MILVVTRFPFVITRRSSRLSGEELANLFLHPAPFPVIVQANSRNYAMPFALMSHTPGKSARLVKQFDTQEAADAYMAQLRKHFTEMQATLASQVENTNEVQMADDTFTVLVDGIQTQYYMVRTR